MAKWVLDRTIAPYPILKKQGTYYSVVNYDPNYTFDEEGKQISRNLSTIKRSQGKNLGKSLTITFSEPNVQTGGKKKPDNAQITVASLSRPCIDKDTLNYNFNYDKVQLPYYNEVGTGNYTKNTSDGKSRVVTGWMITDVTTSASDETSYTAANYPAAPTTAYNSATYDAPNYNFADRKSSQKDLYTISGRVFSQGAYFDVPYNVTGITIEPYWGDAAYVSDSHLDVTYTADDNNKTYKSKTSAVFKQYATTSSITYVTRSINGVEQNVYTSISDALGQLGGSTVYDNAVVLVGNLHQNNTPSTGTKAFTMMSADLDFDNEPDYSMIYHHSARKDVAPIRYDFLNIPGTAMTQKPKGANCMLNMSIYNLKGWFEVTNTCNVSFVQFEYYNGADKVLAPVIFQGGMVDQFVSTKTSSPVNGTGNKPFVNYIHVGGNAWFKDFGNGTHSDGSKFTPHIPISVTGGDFENFYLSGTYKPTADVAKDNAECYISGGRFGEMAGAAQQQIAGDVNWQIYDADIRDFYGGGINADKPITGDITVYIYNSHVTTYCGGPKFGDMAGVKTVDPTDDKTVRTIAEGCTFGQYFGAGYGGTSYLRKRYYDEPSAEIGAQDGNYTGDRGKYYDGITTNTPNNKDGKKGPGIATDFDYELFTWSDGRVGSRFYVKFASFSLAKTNDVHSELTNCTVIGSFYGGGHLGEVTGTAYSKLDGCKVYGNVFGGGYSAEVPKVPVRDGGFATAPKYLKDAGVLTKAKFTDTHDYVWTTNALPNNGNLAINQDSPAPTGNVIYTTDGLSTLGQVKETQLTISGNTYVRGMIDGTVPKPEEDLGYSGIDGKTLYGVATGGKLIGGVFGGGDASKVSGSASVSIINTISTDNGINNVYGGGNTASVLGNDTVQVIGGTMKDVYGGGRGETTVVSGKVIVNIGKRFDNTGTLVAEGAPTISHNVYGGSALGKVNGDGTTVDLTKTTAVTLYKGNVAGSVFGGGLGQRGTNSENPGIAANVYGPVTVTVEGGTAGKVFGCNDQNGAPQSTVAVLITNTAAPTTEIPNPIGSVYGGGNLADYTGSPTVRMDNGTVGYLYGGGLGSSAIITGNTSVTLTNGTVKNDVYGGGEEASVTGTVTVNIQGGTVTNDVYGGGALADSNTANWVSGNLVYSYLPVTGLTTTSSVDGYYTLSEGVYSPASGKAAANTDYYEMQNTTAVNLVAGTINGNVYGGGLGKIAVAANTEQNIAAVAGVEAKVYGDVTVKLNEAADNCIVNGSIFGCNNLNGSPQGSVTVHVYGTKGIEGKPTKMTRDDYFAATDAVKEAHRYDLKAVYGGGNKAAYTPVNSLLANNSTNANDIAKAHTNVIIEGCDRSSIRQVYGGGNAASTPGTEVTIRGAYEIEEVFGGGNGKPSDEVPDNNGANVGYKADTDTEGTPGDSYGSGKAKVNIHGGTIHSIYGGSNTKGNVREAAIAMLEKEEESSGNLCALWVDEAYGGGKSAPMNGRAELQLGCIPGVGRVYGGARSANVNNDVNLRIINGKYDKVYGGNNESGRILGSITVEIEEVGCEKIEIGELFGGGNKADYYATDIPNDDNHNSSLEFSDATDPNYYKNFPRVNVLSATKIGKVFGGGDNAEVTGNPHVKIDMVQGQLTGKSVKEPLGKIAQVFGGGNNAGVNGSTYVDVIKGQIKKIVTTAADPSQNIAEVAIMPGVYGGCNTSGTIKTVTETVSGETVTYGGDTHVNIVGANANDLIIGETGALAEVCGGGLGEQTEVKNNAYVKIGSEGTTSGTYSGKASILGDIYGGSAFGKVNNTEVDLYSLGTSDSPFSGNVYGGGKGSYTESSTTGNIAAQVKGTAKVNMIAATVTGGIYGGCNINGTTKAAEVNMLGGTLGVEGTKKADLLFAGGKGKETTTTDATMNIGSTSSGSATIYSNVYGGSALGAVGVSASNEVNGSATVNLYQATAITGDVFGDGMGDVATNAKARMGNSTVYLYSLDLSNSNIYGGCNYNGMVYGKATVNLIGGSVAEVYGGGQGQLTQVANSGSVEVNVGTAVGSGSTTVTGDIYGGSAFGGVNSPIVNVYSATSIGGNVFGGGKGQLAAENQAAITATVTGKTTVNMMGATVPKAIYGGCNENGTSVDAEINVTGGTVGSTTKTADVLYGVFGGGYGSSTAVNGNVEVNIGKATTTGTEPNTTTSISGNANVYGDVYGGSAQGTVNKDEDATTKTTTTKVHLYAGQVGGNVYGGGLGVKPTSTDTGIPAYVYGDVFVDLNDHNGTCVVNGSIFGCNNAYGSPEGHVIVHVYKTVSRTGQASDQYDLASVYGGGNEADYEPNDATQSTEVIIEGCDETSIGNVYGGGNAAAVPASDVLILGTKIINNVFGGGNGESGAGYAAHVGFHRTSETTKTNYTSGLGRTYVKLVGGTINTVYGGSNSNGDIRGGSNIIMPSKDNYTAYSCCDNLVTQNVYGGGRNADMSSGTSIVMGCMPNDWIEEIYAGSREADINGDVSLTITSGKFERVFGGNKTSGKIRGSITVNIEETTNCATPIIIGELYGGGNMAGYSVYGYNSDGTLKDKATFDAENEGKTDAEKAVRYKDPQLNVRSFTSIGAIFGGGYSAEMVADPTVNINVVKGSRNTTEIGENHTPSAAPFHNLPYPAHASGAIGSIGNVFGGGNLAKVYGSATVNVGTEEKAYFITEPIHLRTNPSTPMTPVASGDYAGLYEVTVEGANITGNVYGGGNLADVTGNTQVNICAKKSGNDYIAVAEGASKVTIGGNVYGGGKGVARESGDRAFFCEEAMVGIDGTNSATNNNSSTYANYGTHVRIGNGTIGNGTTGGNVYGGGEIGRVEFHTEVVIGLGEGTGAATKSPVINGSVFGAGKGTNTHGYSGLVRGDSRVTIQGDAKVGHSVYGGGEMASVGKYEVVNGLPKTPLFGGKCTVTIGGYAEIGPDGMLMTQTGGPDDTGHVFGAGKGTLPYENVTGTPWSMQPQPTGQVKYDNNYTPGTDGLGYEAAYYKFIQSLGLASNTDVTIGGHAFVKGSVYGGSENGYVQTDTHVTIAGGQIGEGQNQTTPYADADFIDPSTTTVTTSHALATCATWTYDKETTGVPYDKYADETGYDSKGGAVIATDGHTYYGNVFGGGRGVVPFAAGKWHRAAGSVGGNTQVDITAGHILSSVYGGNENTDVGSYALGTDGEPTTTLEKGGTCTINMSGGTVGVPRTKEQIENNPVIGNVFGAGKGDKRVLFNTWTNVGATSVNISGTATIYGSVFGGGEDGHVIGNAVSNIGGTVTTGIGNNTTNHSYSKVVIGSTGISGADGNVFGGGRGSETALTAGVVGGNVTLTINNGKILGSVYGGGRLASVGTNFVNPDITSLYGKMQSGDDHGHVTVNINGGFIGTSTATGVNGNIFGAGKGTANNFDLGIVKSTKITMTNGTAYASVFGGGELAQVVESHTTDGQVLGTEIAISGGTIGIEGKGREIWGNVFAGGKGNITHVEAGLVKSNTKVTISQADDDKPTTIYHNIYGGGAYGSVGTFTYANASVPSMPVSCASGTGTATVAITGGTIGVDGDENGMVFGSSRGDVGAPGEIHDYLAWVYDAHVTIGTSGATTGPQINGSVYGSGENGHTYHDAEVIMHSGTVGITEGKPIGSYTAGGASYPYRGNLYGGGCGTDLYDSNNDGTKDSYNALAGVVYGDTQVTIDGGQVVHNVYGAGAMGSVGLTNATGAIIQDGTTAITISGGKIGVDGTKGDGNVFGAARGDFTSTQPHLAQVRSTSVSMSNGTVYGNVYGGGEAGDVGTYVKSADGKNYTWDKISDQEIGSSAVEITGGTVNGHVFGAGKGEANTFTCEKAMVRTATVNISAGMVAKNVYGGGEVGRVDQDSKVTLGVADQAKGSAAPVIAGDVFGAGAGKETHGYSALVRGNAEVIVQGNAKVDKSVYGGGEIAAVGRYGLDSSGMPSTLVSGGECKVTVKGYADIEGNVFGAGEGVDESKKTYTYTTGNTSTMPKRMMTYDPDVYKEGYENPYERIGDYVWEYYPERSKYLKFLQTLALTTDTKLSIEGNARVKGSVYGGSESGFVQRDTEVKIQGAAGTDGSIIDGNIYGGGKGLATFAEAGRVNGGVTIDVSGSTARGSVFGGGELGVVVGAVKVGINNGTIEKDVYGGGALAHTQTGNWDTTNNTWLADKITDGKTVYKTTVNLLGGTIKGDAYGGGLGDLAARGTGHSDVAAMVYGDVFVTLDGTAFDITKYEGKDIVKSGRVFGCNNLNGSPKGDVTVTVNKTVTTASGVKRTPEDPNNTGRPPMGEGVNVTRSYELAAAYGGGNLADYEAEGIGRKTHVIINSCDVSINQVYGGGNAAKVPETDVLVNGAYEIHQVFGGGNGADMYTLDNGASWKVNPGADIDGNANTLMKGGYIHEAYGGSNEKGTITGNITIDTGTGGLAACPVQVDKLVGAGKNADVNGNLIIILGCKDATKIPIVYGGADNAHVNGNVELTITSGRFGQVFGGNNLGGVIKGHIYLNIEETSDCEPIRIDDLYLGGNQAAYSRFGYYVKTTTTEGDGATGVGAPDEEPVLNADAKLILLPRTSIDDRRKPVNTYTFDEVNNKWTWTLYPETGDDAFKPYEQPVLNVTSCTSIGRVFGGGLGEGAAMYADPTVNINMIPGKHAETQLGGDHKLGQIGTGYTDTNNQRVEGGVFGGGNEAAVYGNTTVNIGTEKTVKLHLSVVDANTGEYTMSEAKNVEGANILSNVYGGGNEADVTGNTYVNVCAEEADDASTADVIEYKGVTISGTGYEGVTIAGNVFGGGKGKADTFLCEKAMIGKDGDGVNNPDGGTHVTIGNGTVDGNVYGGGEIGRVEKNTVVTIGLADAGSDMSKPVIKGSVFGGGKGEEEHGYAALVRGNPTVIIQADAKVEHNVYGGGEIASVARYNVPRTEEEVEAARVQGYDAHLGMPYALANTTSGNCKVTVKDNAIIGPDEPMKMYHSEITDGSDKPDDAGHVFGAGKGILPQNYTYVDKEHKPKRMVLRDETIHTDAKKGTDWDYVDPNDNNNKNVWEYFADRDAYIIFIQTLALSSYANVTIGDDTSKPFVKGSVYGGSENGLVQFDTKVYIKSGQIGCGKNATAPYGDDVWADGYVPTDDLECASWDYGLDTNNDGKKDLFAPYDPNANATGDLDKYPPITGQTKGKSTEGGRRIASDGHTYYGNVFGGGSGSVPYFDTTEGISKYLSSAGTVKGNTYVEISGGHILTNVYGGCEATNVLGKATVKMTDGSIGVPRTPQQIKDHPVTCYLFGAGKGDQRIYFNKETNVNDAIANVEGGRIYGSVFGGGEDGHVLRNTSVTIGKTDGTGPKIGTVGSTYVDGNVFGGGRGFGGEALTAGNVGGSVDLTINGGTMLGSIYGGGRLASVGYGLYLVDEEVGGVKPYGKMREDNEYDGSYPDPSPEAASAFYTKGRGHITVNINGGTIGSDVEDEHSGNVFGGSMGRLAKIDGSPFDDPNHWALLATAKTTEVNVTGGIIKRNVYGGGEMGTVIEKATVNISGGTIGKSGGDNVEIGNVFGGGKGYLDPAQTYVGAGIVKGNTNVTIKNGASGGTTTTPTIYQNVYGGGELGYVGMFTTPDHKEYTWTENTGLCTVGVAGGTITGHVFGAGKGKDDTFECERAMVRTTSVAVSGGKVGGNVYGGGEVGRVDQNSAVTIGSATGDSAPTITGSVFGAGAGVETHGYSALVRGNTAVIVQGNAKVGNSVYGGGQIAAVGRYGLDSSGMPSTLVSGGECVVTVQGNAVIGANGIGNVFGAGMGVDESKKTYTYADNANRPKRMMTYASGLYTDANKALWEFSDATHTYVWEYFDTKTKYLNFLQTLALATDTRLTINGNASVKGSVYGGSESGFVQRDTEVKILGGEIQTVKDAAGNTTEGNVFGGGKGISDNDAAGRVRSDTRITVLDGTINGDVYGGGALGKANTLSATNTTIVNLLGGTIKGDVFGGGLGNATTAADIGNTKVNLNGMTTEELNSFSGDFKTLLTTTLTGLKEFTKKGAVVKGNIFGANNVNGTPKGHVLVHVHGTQNETTSALNAKVDGLYDVTGVFGGGNASDYVPDASDAKQSTEVIIEGCDLTSIEEVYGGGYGAAVPATDVLIKGTKIINNVFGGGYGAGTDNPGANVGYVTGGSRSPYALGTGKAVVQLMAGTVNNVYGGSNTKGDIRSGSNVTNVANDNSPGCCDKLSVKEIYGGGSQADMFGGTEIVLGCMPDDWIGAIYAGAENANVGNDVSLTLTSGKFGRVFGGNKSGGTIDGYIEVNIEENSECSTPIIIGGLYGGGNEAPYSTPARYFTNNPNYQSPRVNVRAFTSIGNIYGGGFGASATVTGNPLVNINEVQGGREYAGEDKPLEDGTTVKLYARKADSKMGVIGNVFGGGNAAKVIGNTNVMIGTEAEQEMESLKTTDATTGTVTVVKKPVLGADIQGNVYGAGNNAEVTGHTNVVIGKKAE